jgi:hypothetical protein
VSAIICAATFVGALGGVTRLTEAEALEVADFVTAMTA